MIKPLLTCIIPCHNYSMFVETAIRSVQSQSMNNFECMVINDSSTDNSEDVIREAIKGDSRFKLFNVSFGNLSATRNFGIEQGTAPYICMCDADDEIGHPDYFEVLIGELEKDRTLGIAYSSITLMDGDGKLGGVAGWPPPEFSAEGQYNHINQIPSMCIFQREMWRRVGGFIRYFVYVQDANFWTTAIDIGYGAKHVVSEGWFHYRIHKQSQSQAHRDGTVKEPNWLEWHPWATNGQRPFAAGGKAPRGSWPVRFYNKPEISVIIPVGKGHEDAVKDALHSVEGQTFRNWECIVVNDSGHHLHLDNGFSWTKEFTTRGGIGAGAARNVGARFLKSKFLVFLDADDMLKPRFLEATLAAYRQYGRYAYTDWLTHERQTNWKAHPTPEYSFQAVWERPSIHPVTTLIPRMWFDKVGGFDEKMTAFEDVDFYMRMLINGFCGVRVSEPLLIYNLDSGYRRKSGEAIKEQFKKLLTKRYGAYMEGTTMCNCVEPPKGLSREAPTPENLAAYKDTYGEMVKVQLTWDGAGTGQVAFNGPATRVPYGRRALGDVFYVWEKDVSNSEGVFTVLNDYETEIVTTVIPPEPKSLKTPEDYLPEGWVMSSEPATIDDVPEVVPKSQQVSKPKTKAKPKANRRA